MSKQAYDNLANTQVQKLESTKDRKIPLAHDTDNTQIADTDKTSTSKPSKRKNKQVTLTIDVGTKDLKEYWMEQARSEGETVSRLFRRYMLERYGRRSDSSLKGMDVILSSLGGTLKEENLSEVNEENLPEVNAEESQDPPKSQRGKGGKRSDPNYVQVGAYIPISLHKAIKRRLVDEEENFSELVIKLLDEWLSR